MAKTGIGDITLLQISDLRCIKFVSIELDPSSGELIKIAGPNDSGKSTILDSLKFAFEGAANIPKGVIRNGLYTEGKMAGKEIDRANIRVETNEGYIIERIIRKDKHGQQVAELSITKKGEGQIASAQTFLNEMSTKYPDPTVIAELPGDELFREIVKIADIDLSSIDSQIEEIKLDLKSYRKELKNLGEVQPPEGERVNPMNAREALDTLQEMRANRDEKKRLTNEVGVANEEIMRLQNLINQAIEKRDTIQNQLRHKPDVSDEEIQIAEAQVNDLDEHNKKAAAWEEYDRKVEEQQKIETNLEQGKKMLDQMHVKREEELLNADLPEGLYLEDGTVWLQGDPRVMWDSLSTSKKLELSTMLAIRSIPETAPKYLYVQRGESLGGKRRREIAEVARRNGAKILMEVMSENPESEDNAIVVKDGDIITKTASQPDEYDLF